MKAIFALILLVAGGAAVSAQEGGAKPPGPDTVKVLVDCVEVHCDEDFIRSKITYVDHVRDRQDADVHVLVTARSTGSGGTEYTLKFIGRGPFQGSDDELTCTTAQTDTEDARRRALVNTLELGLVRYVSHTALGRELEVVRRPRGPSPLTPGQAAGQASADRWDFWVFRTRLDGSLTGEQSNAASSVSASFSANRTTDAWKVNLSASGSYYKSTYIFEEGGRFDSVTKSYGMDGLVVKSLTGRWSAGLIASLASSTYYNQALVLRAAPAIEFNIFPYTESTRRALTLRYEIGMNANRYREMTVFSKTSEGLVDQKVKLSADARQPWGSISADLEAAHYVPGWSKRHVIASVELDVKLFKGFSFNVDASTSRIHDQVYLPRGRATDEQVLVRQRQLATSYRYSVWLGISYSFGSIYNNVVNTRLSSGSGGYEWF